MKSRFGKEQDYKSANRALMEDHAIPVPGGPAGLGVNVGYACRPSGWKLRAHD